MNGQGGWFVRLRKEMYVGFEGGGGVEAEEEDVVWGMVEKERVDQKVGGGGALFGRRKWRRRIRSK